MARLDNRGGGQWTFTEDAVHPEELGLRTPVPIAGEWRLQDDVQATGGRALVNQAARGPDKPALALARALRARDFELSTRCKVQPEGRSCGVVFRLQNDANFYVAYIDVGTQEVCLAAVLGGTTRVLQRHSAPVVAGVWQLLTVRAHRDDLSVSLNGRRLVRVADSTHTPAGDLGPWAPAGDTASFDELVVRPAAGGA